MISSHSKSHFKVLPLETEVRELYDEHAQSMFVRVATRMLEMVETLRESITKDEILPAVSLVVTVGFIMLGGSVIVFIGFAGKFFTGIHFRFSVNCF